MSEIYALDLDCIPWKGGFNKGGYGRATHSKDAHVVAYENKYGSVPKGMQLDHLCRHRWCVNPDHLEPVTQAENIRRGVGTRLDWERVHEIRRLSTEGLSQRKLAEQFGVHHTTIQAIVEGRTWQS